MVKLDIISVTLIHKQSGESSEIDWLLLWAEEEDVEGE